MKYLIIIISIILLSCSKTKDYNNVLEIDENCYLDPGILSSICKKDNSYFIKWER